MFTSGCALTGTTEWAASRLGTAYFLPALFAVLWLGGWAGPLESWLGWLWTLLKGFVVAVVIIWMRVSWPRMREDQLQRLAWVWLVPIALVQLAITAVGVVIM